MRDCACVGTGGLRSDNIASHERSAVPQERGSLPGRGSDRNSEKKKKNSRFLSTQEAAEYLGVSDTTFRKYRNMGKIPFRKVGMKLY